MKIGVKENKLFVDKEELFKLIDNPAILPDPLYDDSSAIKHGSRKPKTQKQYMQWQEAYKNLKEERPSMSDVWYSLQIAKQEIANGRDSETIRKHMKG